MKQQKLTAFLDLVRELRLQDRYWTPNLKRDKDPQGVNMCLPAQVTADQLASKNSITLEGHWRLSGGRVSPWGPGAGPCVLVNSCVEIHPLRGAFGHEVSGNWLHIWPGVGE